MVVVSTNVTVSAEDLKRTVASYASEASKIALAYQHAQTLMNAYYPKDRKGERHSIYDPIEDIDLTDALTDIVKTAVVNNIKDYRTSIEKDESGDETKSVKSTARWYSPTIARFRSTVAT